MNKGGTQPSDSPKIMITAKRPRTEHIMNINWGHGMHGNGNTNHDCITAQPASRPAPRTRQPWSRLLKAVLDLAGDRAELVRHVERDWASATFAGTRHAMTLRFTGAAAAEAGESFIAKLPDHDFSIPRYIVADAQIIAVDDQQLPTRKLTVEIELLLLDRA
jgi:hypothetical protein